MTRILMIALAAATFSTAASAQVTPESIAAQLQSAGVTDIVIYNNRGTVRATGTDGGNTVEYFFDRASGEQVSAPPSREERAEVRSFIEGLRDTYDESTDGSFRDYVAAEAASAGVDLPERGPRGGGEARPERGDGESRPERGEGGDRPERGEGEGRPERGEGGGGRPARG